MITITKKRLFILSVSLISLFSISWFELYLQRTHNLIGGGINRASLFILINIHIIAIIILLFLITRQSIKLFVERQQTQPGSIFKRNILFAFILFSVIPSMFVFFTAGKFITKSIDYWFLARIHTGLDESINLHKIHTSRERKKIEQNGQKFLEEFLINKKLKHKNLYAWSTNSQELYAEVDEEARVWRSYRKLNDRTIKSLRLRFARQLEALGNDSSVFDFYGSLYWAKRLDNKILVLTHRYPESIRTPLIKIQSSRIDYEHLKTMRNPIYLNYLFSFILITLIIIFLSIWCAFYLARGISRPIQELLDATTKLRKGMWGVHINNNSNNDLHELIIEFNSMTSAIHKARSQLENKINELMMILENITSSVFLINRFGRILTFNAASKKLIKNAFSISPKKNAKISIFPESLRAPFFDIAKELIKTGKQQIVKEVYPTINDRRRVFVVQITRLNINTMLDKSSEEGLLVVIEDLTTIVKESQMKTWQTAAKQMAHEIKNPLTPIQLATQRLQRKYRDVLANDQAFIGCTNTILEQVTIIKDLASHFSEFASMPAPHIEAININEIINELLFLYKESYPNIGFILSLHEPIPMIKSDAKKLKRVFVNLLDNSVRALESNIKQCIEIKTFINTTSQSLSVTFSDNGPGINQRVKDQLFLPHVSAEKKNMGLGLAIVHDIITHQLQGSIELVSTEIGACFKIQLPI